MNFGGAKSSLFDGVLSDDTAPKTSTSRGFLSKACSIICLLQTAPCREKYWFLLILLNLLSPPLLLLTVPHPPPLSQRPRACCRTAPLLLHLGPIAKANALTDIGRDAIEAAASGRSIFRGVGCNGCLLTTKAQRQPRPKRGWKYHYVNAFISLQNLSKTFTMSGNLEPILITRWPFGRYPRLLWQAA